MEIEQLAFSTNAFKQSSLHEALQSIASIGYRGVEVMADEPHMRPDRYSNADVHGLRKQIDDLGLTVSNVNAFTGFCFANGDTYHPTWVETDAKFRRQRIDHTKRAIELTTALGCSHISLQPGGLYLQRDMYELFEMFAEGIDACLPTARACEVTLGIEPEPGLMIENTKHFRRLKDDYFAREPLIQMNCDLGHFYCVREDPAHVLRQHSQNIHHIHLEDISHQRVHQHLVPGDGVMDFQAIFDAIDETRYKGWVTVELYPYTASAEDVARRAYERLCTILES